MQEGIKVIDVRLTKIGVNSFSLNDATVTFEISFDDGIRKQVYKTAKLDEPAELANAIVQGIITMEENINMEFDGQDLIGNTSVVLNNGEDARVKMAEFFEDVYAKFCRVKNAKISDGYMDSVKKLQNSELRFNV
ncbi:MAG: hypothetical protein V1702_01930 [Candidatus Woesearchaeota archaeon]